MSKRCKQCRKKTKKNRQFCRESCKIDFGKKLGELSDYLEVIIDKAEQRLADVSDQPTRPDVNS